jgi:DNA-binding transcriptional LysR family regulator
MARFSLPQLEAFHWLAELGSFKAVSERLNLSQPTITTRVRELERELGVTLIDRQVGRSVPTAAGRALLDDVRGILRHAERIAVKAASRPGTTVLRLGLPDTLACTHLAGMMSAVAAADESIRLDIDVDHSQSLYGKVLNDTLDFAFVATDRVDPSVALSPICEIALAWAQPVAAEMLTTADPKALVRRTVITTPSPSNLSNYTLKWLGDLRPTRLATCSRLSSIVDLIAGGCGVGIVPVALIDQRGHADRVAVIESNRMLAPDRVDLVYRPAAADRGLASLLADCCAFALVQEPRAGIRSLH